MNFHENNLARLCTISACLILFIWVLPDTIALRHALLILGFIPSIFLIKNNWSRATDRPSRLLPLCALIGLFLWVGFHYIFFSLNPELELREIRGLWVRAFAGFVIAIGLGISLVKYPSLRKYFYIAVFSTPAINVSAYLRDCYLQQKLVQPNAFVWFLFTKIETAYFGAVAASVSVGNLISLLNEKKQKSYYLKIVMYLFGLFLVLISALVSSTKNGMVIALGLCVFLALVMIWNLVVNLNGSKRLSLIILVFVVTLSLGIWKGHQSTAYQGWNTVFQDAKVGFDIDGNEQWHKLNGSVPMPLNESGVPAAGNTYHRIAWATVGMRLIGQYPFGYGSINQSFVGLLNESRIYHENQGQTHSGWVDFGLAFGLPGLLLMLITMLSIIFYTLRDKNVIAIPWAVFCLGFIPFGMISEITWKQYFEATIFFLSLGATFIALKQK